MSLRRGFISSIFSGEAPPPPNPNTFTFTVPTGRNTVSAAAYDMENNLLRNIFDAKPFANGQHVYYWNREDNDGNEIEGQQGVDFRIRVATHSMSPTWVGAFVGNTSTADYGPTKLRSFAPMCSGVLVGNRYYAATAYDEGKTAQIKILFPDIQLKNQNLLNGENGNNGLNTQFAASNGKIVIFGGFDPFAATNSMVFGVYVKDDSVQYPFSVDSVSYECAIGMTYTNAIAFVNGAAETRITGLAINDTHIYVARGGIDTIQILSITGELLAENTSFTNPCAISVSGSKMVFDSGADGSRVTKSYTLSGTSITEDVTYSGIVDPLNTSITPEKYNFYFEDIDSSGITGYETLDTYIDADGAIGEASVSVTANNTNFLLKSFVTDIGNPSATKVPAATWNFSAWCTSLNLTTFLRFSVFKRDASGTETLLFSADTTTIFSSYAERTASSSQGEIALATTDRIVVKVFARKTGGVNATVFMRYNNTTYPSTMGISPATRYVYVIDGGASQQLKCYNLLTGASVFTQGDEGGYDNGPDVTNTKFYFDDGVTDLYNPSSLGRPFLWTMLDDSYWVMDVGNYRLQHYLNDQTYVERIMWLPNNYSANGDINNPDVWFGQYLQFSVPLDAPENWSLEKNWRWRVTADFFGDSLIDMFNAPTTFSNGERYALCKNFTDSTYELVWLDDETGMVYTGEITPEFLKVSMYKDGSIIYADIADYNQVGSPVAIKERTVSSYTGTIPNYTADITVATPPNIEPNDGAGDCVLYNAEAPVKTDNGQYVWYNIGHQNVNRHMNYIDAGASQYKIKSMFSTYRSESQDAYGVSYSYLGPYPTDNYHDIGNGVEYPGSSLMSSGNFEKTDYKGEFWQQSQTNYHRVHYQGMMLFQCGVSAEQARALSDTDEAPMQMAGNLFSGNLFAQVGTELIWNTNDESNHGALHFWRATGTNTLAIQNAVAGGTYVPSTAVNLLEQLPFRNVVTTADNFVRNPDSEYYTNFDNNFMVRSGRKTYLPYDANNDIYYIYRSNANQDANFDTIITPNVATEFTLAGSVMWGGTIAFDDNVSIYLQILDDTDKVIANMRIRRDLAEPFTRRVYANGDEIISFSTNQEFLYTRFFQDFSFRVHAGGCDIEYAGEQLTNVAMVDPTADRFQPTKFRIMSLSDDWPYDQQVYIGALNYTES